MLATVNLAVRADGLYVNGRWVIDVDYGRIDVLDEAEAVYYSALWGTRCHDEGDGCEEELWWVELPRAVWREVALLGRLLSTGPGLLN